MSVSICHLNKVIQKLNSCLHSSPLLCLPFLLATILTFSIQSIGWKRLSSHLILLLMLQEFSCFLLWSGLLQNHMLRQTHVCIFYGQEVWPLCLDMIKEILQRYQVGTYSAKLPLSRSGMQPFCTTFQKIEWIIHTLGRTRNKLNRWGIWTNAFLLIMLSRPWSDPM